MVLLIYIICDKAKIFDIIKRIIEKQRIIERNPLRP